MRKALIRFRAPMAFAVLGLGLFPVAPSAQAPDALSSVKIRADGYAGGSGRTAEAEALTDAERVAVELAVVDIVGERWLDRVEPIFNNVNTYVRTSRPINVERSEEGVQVRAEVYVYDSQLRRDLAAVLFESFPQKPTVVFLLGEQIEGYRNWTVADGAAQRFLQSRFVDARFQIIDPRSRFSDEALASYQAGNPRQIGGFGRDARADVVVRGDVTAQLESESTGVNVNRVYAKVEIELIRPVDGLVIERFESTASVNSTDAAMGGEQAIKDAAAKIAQSLLVGCVLAYATQPPPQDFIVSVRIPQTGPWLTRARNAIGQRFPTARLQDLHHTPGQARFRVAADVSLADLVHGLTDSRFDDFELVTERAVDRELDLELIPQ